MILELSDRLLADVIRNLSSEDSPYLFSTLPVEILGAVYEQFIGKVVRIKGRQIKAELKPEVRKAGGVYYTPRYIVSYIVDETIGKLLDGKSPNEVSKLRFVDPSCGSGSFLIKVLERIVEHYVEWFDSHPNEQKEQLCYRDATGALILTTHLKRKIVRDNIFGVDVDFRAVEVTMLSLYLKILEGETRTTLGWQHSFFPTETFLPDLSQNIKCGNSLVGSDFFDGTLLGLMEVDGGAINAFEWKQEFPLIIKRGGFDAIVGNPPYIRIQLLKQSDPEQLRYFGTHYLSAKQGSYDIYVIFVEKSLSLLNRQGLMGYILPNKFLTTDYGRALRGALAGRGAVSQLIDFGHDQVFDGASTFTCLLFLSSAMNETLSFASVQPAVSLALSTPQFRTYQSSQLDAESWVFASPGNDTVRQKMMVNAVPLLELPTLISRGTSTGADPLFMLEKVRGKYFTRDGEPVDIEEGILRIPVYATDFNRYSFHPKGAERVIFPYNVDPTGYALMSQKELSMRFPKAYSYLTSKRRALQKRKQFSAWYGFSAPRNLTVHETAQMFVPLLADKGSLCEISGKQSSYCLMASGGFSISVLPDSGLSHYYILGLLNSELLFWFLRGISNKFRGGWITCTKQYIGKLPIKLVDKKSKGDAHSYEQIVKCAKTLITLKTKLDILKGESERMRTQRQVERLEAMINDLVYGLYQIFEDERAAIQQELGAVSGIDGNVDLIQMELEAEE